MKNDSLKESVIFFENYTFNPMLRTLHSVENTQQLRKKQSDVLALLCIKYPNPVSLDDFLVEVWDGSYVTSQSIAQMIRSLRITLKDESKTLIVNIPKLGYRLNVEPNWGTVGCSVEQTVKQKAALLDSTVHNVSSRNGSFFNRLTADDTKSIISSQGLADKSIFKRPPIKKWLFSTALVFCLSLVCIVISSNGFA